MRVILEEVENIFYLDLILSPSEIEDLLNGEMLQGGSILNRTTLHVGVRVCKNYVYNKRMIDSDAQWIN